MSIIKSKLTEAGAIALQMFNAIEEGGLITAGKTENQLNIGIFQLAEELLY